MTKEKFTQELLNTAEILENLRVELLNLETFDDKLIKLVKLININNYRIKIQTIENNGICFAIKAKYGLTKYPKQIFTLWEKGIKKDTIIVYKDNTIMWGDLYYNQNYSIDEIIEEISFFQNDTIRIF